MIILILAFFYFVLFVIARLALMNIELEDLRKALRRKAELEAMGYTYRVMRESANALKDRLDALEKTLAKRSEKETP